MLRNRSSVVVAVSLGLIGLVACGGTDTSTSAAATAASAPVSYQSLTPAETDALLHDPPDGLIVLDVRTPAEFAEGHIAGAVDVDLEGATFESDVAELDPTTPYLVYCRSGNRSAQAVAYLQQQNFTSIYELEGGTNSWAAAGLPLVEG